MSDSKVGNEMFSKMRIRMWEAHASFEIYRAVQYSKGIDIYGKEIAERNAKTISRYKEFFTPVMQSLFANSTLVLWQFFDKEQNLGYLALLKEMKATTNHRIFEDLKIDIASKLLPHKPVIEKIQKLRHEQIAHTNKKGGDGVELKMIEVEQLYSVTQEVFNLLSGHFEDSKTMFPLDHKEAKGEVDALMRDLSLGFEEFKESIHKTYFPEEYLNK